MGEEETPVTPSITVTSPNGGEQMIRGSNYDIRWTKSGPTGNKVNIELWKGGVYFQTIFSLIDNDGKKTWSIPSTLLESNSYKIKIIDASNANVFGMSESNFSIVSPFLTVTSPNGGETWRILETHNITWTKTSGTGDTVTIKLFKAGNLSKIISSSAAIQEALAGRFP